MVQLTRVTIAVNDMSAMVAFYNVVFDCGLVEVTGTPFYAGTLAGLRLVFCPNSITQITAEKNRQQLHLTVDDLAAVLVRVREHGGRVQDTVHESGGMKMIGVADPDGNTIELAQLIDGG